jgi:hypothetical protein
MLDTYSSWRMYPVIKKQLTAAAKEIHRATKAIGSGNSLPGVAKEAFKKTIAAIFACDGQSHWRLDTESPEDCEKIARKVSKLLKDLLWFKDEEVGLVVPYSRKALFARFEHMQKECSYIDYMDCIISQFKTAKNGRGMGRPDDAQRPAAKKARTTVPSDPNHALVSYLSGISDKLSLRVKTHVQVKIARDAEPQNPPSLLASSCRVPHA